MKQEENSLHEDSAAIRIQTARSGEQEHSVPIFLSSSYVYDSADQAHQVFAETMEGNVYSRYNNPNVDELVAKMKAMEGAEDGIALASGMGAIASVLLGSLRAGDHVLASKAIFGSTFGLITNWLPRFGIEYTLVGPGPVQKWAEAIRPNTRMLFVETPSNPVLDVLDIAALSALAHANSALLAVDASFASPFSQKTLQMGADFSIHSATKYIDGQGRCMGGIALASREHLADPKAFSRASGPTLSAFNAWLLSKSLETLGLRMERHAANALELAKYLEQHPRVSWVRYPGLPSHPHHDIARRQMKDGGGMIAFEVRGGQRGAFSLIDALKVISRSVNLGDSRSIITHPYTTTHLKVPENDKAELGITDATLRFSVGLEAVQDLRADLEQALDSLGA